MGYAPGETFYGGFTTQRLDTGFATNADSTPVITANRNGADDAAFVITATSLDAGRYRIQGTIPVTYAEGDVVIIYATASVNGIQGKAVVDAFIVQGAAGAQDWNSTERAQIRRALGVTGTQTATTTGDLQNIKSKTDSLVLNGSGHVNIALDQSVGASQAAGTVGRALQLARAQAGGRWVIDGNANTLTLYDTDNTTVVKVFDLTPTGGPYSTRTPQANG